MVALERRDPVGERPSQLGLVDVGQRVGDEHDAHRGALKLVEIGREPAQSGQAKSG